MFWGVEGVSGALAGEVGEEKVHVGLGGGSVFIEALEEISGALGCSVGTVKSRLFNALEKLRRMNALGRGSAGAGVKGGKS